MALQQFECQFEPYKPASWYESAPMYQIPDSMTHPNLHPASGYKNYETKGL